jgi:Barstar (barnase inhibitor)
MSTVEQLLKVEESPPILYLAADMKTVAELALGWADAALTVRAVRGSKTRTRQALLDEFSAALQFPYYFGENWPAFNECLADLDWLSISTGVVVLVYEAVQVLADEHPGDMAAFVRAVQNAGSVFGRPVEDGEWWDRSALPFHVVLQLGGIESLDYWRDAGAEIAPIEP